jgi:cyclopropane-fatty-acyl-phospholipid synthase
MNFVNSTQNIELCKLSFRERLAKRRFDRLLSNISTGTVMIVGGEGRKQFGTDDQLSAIVAVKRNRFYRKAMLGPLSIAESFIDGDWDCRDLTTLIRIFLKNRQAIDQSRQWRVQLANFGYRVFHWLHSNTRRGSSRNIAAHYDLGNDFYRLWLDETMAYSSGVFLDNTRTMEEASIEKFDRVCRKLDLQPDDQLLEIGTGFGGLALHAAENFNCDVTTTTISQKQLKFAQSRFDSSVSSEQISLLKQDYRDLAGKFDKIVSIEMIEAVGHRFLDQFFHKCSSLLRDDGSMVLQAIVMPERSHKRYLNSVDFIQRYVFPGGSLPSLASMLESVGRSSDMRFVHAEDMAPHYAETLKRWRIAFHSQLDEVRRRGYSEKLIRLWTFYLCYCEAAFAERQIGVLQVQFDKPGCTRDPIEIGDRAAAKSVTEPMGNMPSFTQSFRNQKKELSSECC